MIFKKIFYARKINSFVLGLVLGCLIVGVYSTARAYMTGQKTLGASVVRTGSLDLKVTPETKLFDFSGLVPGETTGEEKITLENTGDVALEYRISAQPATADDNNDLLKALKVKTNEYAKDGTLLVTHYGRSTKYLSDLTNSAVTEIIPAGEKRDLGIELSLSSTVGNEIAGKSTNFNFVIDAVQQGGSF
ncbi:hypothetical protein COT49_01930 [candidate division WWE3 bacterium CG08_land_8_20_14_0_20_40_13]|uniref:Camelysin metallo-endopeptidase n=1 Tax=candidate division WWE3 bacterium CG08_land_8_20_14_0_20_40_13 TaxID=1975084 RepID=A0A2H0XE29_UNCKA|nr:MAG: hypothetical protein COT49_01930 [candidate division WWE3 bacterium CG08_land_8_20_14_0_20_40_13]